jgi:hypothetical protein
MRPDGTRWGGELSLVKAQRRDSLLDRHDSRDRRPLVFLAVLVSHALIVLLLIRAARQPISPQNDSSEPLVLLFLHDGARAVTNALTPRRPEVLPPAAPPAPALKLEPAPDNAISAPPQTAPPAIDWEHEAELAARNGVADAEKQKNYRDLSALSAEQLSWAKKNHMAPAAPGIPWTHPRFEFDAQTGLPVFWINDHCVLVMLMVFCGIGHIEAEGNLFKHMGDPHDP